MHAKRYWRSDAALATLSSQCWQQIKTQTSLCMPVTLLQMRLILFDLKPLTIQCGAMRSCVTLHTTRLGTFTACCTGWGVGAT